MKQKINRRDFIKTLGLGLMGTASLAFLTKNGQSGLAYEVDDSPHAGHSDGMPMTVGEVDHAYNSFNPTDLLADFDYGEVSTLENGQTLRTYSVVAVDKLVEIVPGIRFPAWAYNGRIPGPTIRCTEGDRIRVEFFNGSSHPHTMHFHGIHPAEMDGVPGTGPGLIQSGQKFTLDFDAYPFGLHLYHCHAFPLARHIAKGLYSAFIIDPQQGRPPADREMVMVMSGFDIDFDNQNDFYAVNGIPFHYQIHPIQIKVGEKVRLYLVNILEYDLINSFHLHANFFHYYPNSTSLTAAEFTDTVMQTQAQRGILEFSYQYQGTIHVSRPQHRVCRAGLDGQFRSTRLR